jgi:hypothetical protein
VCGRLMPEADRFCAPAGSLQEFLTPTRMTSRQQKAPRIRLCSARASWKPYGEQKSVSGYKTPEPEKPNQTSRGNRLGEAVEPSYPSARHLRI